MTRTLTLHVGTPKSGTTHLQAVLHANRDRLRRAGTSYPGAGRLPRDGFNQQPAVYALAGPMLGWVDDRVRRGAAPMLDHLAAEVRAHRGHSLISAESLAFFDPGSAATLLERLGVAPEQVTVVVTARDLGRLLPSVWQQNVKNGSVQELEPYLDSVASLRDGVPSPFWTAFGLPGLVERWSAAVGPERVVLVTVPASGATPDVLRRRFAAAADLPGDVVEAFVTDRQPHRAHDNVSLSASQAELMRQVNLVLEAEGLPRDVQQRMRARLLARWADAPQRRGTALALPAHLAPLVARWAVEDDVQLRRAGVRVVGDLTDLLPRPAAVPAGPPPALGAETARDVLDLLDRPGAPVPVQARRRWPAWVPSQVRRQVRRQLGRPGQLPLQLAPGRDFGRQVVDVSDGAPTRRG
jgi:hypothetical protein